MSESCLFISNLNSSDWASWVQAIGSILAILVAIEFSRRSAQQARKSYSQAKVDGISERFEPVIALLDAAEIECEEIWEACSRNYTSGPYGVSFYLLHNIESIHNALEAVPVHLMPSGVSATSLLSVRVSVRNLVEISKEMVANGANGQAMMPAHVIRFKLARKGLRHELDILKKNLELVAQPYR